ncbi:MULTISPECIES: hypothetical protein [Paenibacillus]|uniref:hypothetical protein n=1 Tax=Paenibacillus TaxID=44249 RepID=UPI001883B95E|nr:MULTISPECIES: hypothetical protein [Paenibacillus]MBE9915128.1 hypothetical protein [Paenibacillus donghaensis]
MRKVDWLIAACFIVIGLMCLTVSALYYPNNSSSGGWSVFKSVCIWMAVIGVVIYTIYRIVQFKRRQGKRE